MTIHVHQKSSSASEAAIRHHRVTIDRPAEKGGADFGPMGGELFLAAVGGCFMSNLLAAINARQAQISAVQTTVNATVEGSPARFSHVELCVAADCKDRDLLEKLVEIADRGCIMTNTLRGTLDLTLRIAARV